MSRGSLSLAATFLLLSIIVVRAQENSFNSTQKMPIYPVLPCIGACPVYTPAKPISLLRLPSSGSDEGAIQVSFTIGTDGQVKGPIVEQAIGDKSILRLVLNYLNEARYEPATENGQPVEENQQAFLAVVPPNWRTVDSNAGVLFDAALEKKTIQRPKLWPLE